MSDRGYCGGICARLRTGFAIAVKFVPTGSSNISSRYGGSAEQLYLNLDCHGDSAIVIYRCNDEMRWHLMECVVVGEAMRE